MSFETLALIYLAILIAELFIIFIAPLFINKHLTYMDRVAIEIRYVGKLNAVALLMFIITYLLYLGHS